MWSRRDGAAGGDPPPFRFFFIVCPSACWRGGVFCGPPLDLYTRARAVRSLDMRASFHSGIPRALFRGALRCLHGEAPSTSKTLHDYLKYFLHLPMQERALLEFTELPTNVNRLLRGDVRP